MRVRGASAAKPWVALQLIAAVTVAAPVSAEPRSPSPVATDTERADARQAYNLGLAAFARGAFSDAAREFSRADQLSSSPNAKLMLGRCLRQLQQLPEAYRVLVSIVRPPEAFDPRYAQTRAAAEDELRVLRSQIGILTVYVRAHDRSALLHVDGQQIQPSEWNAALPVRPGVVKLSLETAPGQIERRELEIGAGQRASIVIGSPDEVNASFSVEGSPRAAKASVPRPVAASAQAIEAPPPVAADSEPATESSAAPSGLRVASYIAGGTSAVSFVAFGIFGTLSAANYAKLEDGCPNRGACSADLETFAARGRMEQTLANVALAVGASTFVAGAIMYIASDPPAPKSERSPARAKHNGASAATPARPRSQAGSAHVALAVSPAGIEVTPSPAGIELTLSPAGIALRGEL
jgi:hypothetical protein